MALFSSKALLTIVAAACSSTVLITEGFVVPTGVQRSVTSIPGFADRSILARMQVTMSPGVDDLLTADDEDDDDDEADFLISSSADLEGVEDDDDDVPVSEDIFAAPAAFEFTLKLAEVREQYRKHETDTGSPEYQVASMTERISYLTSHLKMHPKDFSTRRGLVALVNKRRRLLNYLFEEDVERYKSLVAALGIRHKAPGRVMSRAEKYAKYASKKKSKTRDSL
mmetsp:Transcript_14186/g.18565  ORF Transcript_14186/g.18565 Transcript_14186/m.18565 type:complete len:225 (-) Transcript_14186:135-809(-)